jgi:hypothetical protein
MSSSRNMKVWSRCADCSAWDEDCTCLCGFEPENEELLICGAEKSNNVLLFVEQEQARKEFGYCTSPDCTRCYPCNEEWADWDERQCDYVHDGYEYDYDDDDGYDEHVCYDCGEICSSEMWTGLCGWDDYGRRTSEEYNNPLRVLSRALTEAACPA